MTVQVTEKRAWNMLIGNEYLKKDIILPLSCNCEKYVSLSCPYPCSEDTVLCKTPTNAPCSPNLLIWYGIILYNMICIWYDVKWCDVMWYDIWYDMVWYMIYDKIWYDVTWYDMMWCVVMWCDVMWCDIWYDMIYDVKWCDVIWYMIWYTIWCDMIWYDMVWYMIYMFVNCNWVATRWQQYSTHLHTQTIHGTTQNKQYIEQQNREEWDGRGM